MRRADVRTEKATKLEKEGRTSSSSKSTPSSSPSLFFFAFPVREAGFLPPLFEAGRLGGEGSDSYSSDDGVGTFPRLAVLRLDWRVPFACDFARFFDFETGFGSNASRCSAIWEGSMSSSYPSSTSFISSDLRFFLVLPLVPVSASPAEGFKCPLGFEGEGEVGAAEGSGDESLNEASFRLLLLRLFGVEGVCGDCIGVRVEDRSECGEGC